MKKLLVAEVAVLLLLLVIAVFVRLGIGGGDPQLGGQETQETQPSTEDTQVMGPEFTDPTESEVTEPTR